MDSNIIAQCAQISSALEVSGFPKPGNVHRTRDFDDMVFEDFLISGIVIGDSIKRAAEEGKNLGKHILGAVRTTDEWIANNTNLGIVMLEVPIAAAAGISEDFSEIKKNVVKVMGQTTVDDACNLYDAINIADAGGMGETDEYDVASQSAKEELRKNNQNMYDVLKISSEWDRLAAELSSDMPICFEIGFPCYKKLKSETSLNSAGVLTFLEILSNVPDTLISRKYGEQKAVHISGLAKELLEFVNDDDFEKKLKEFDDYLFENKFNPGTTADLTAASIMISLLEEKFKS